MRESDARPNGSVAFERTVSQYNDDINLELLFKSHFSSFSLTLDTIKINK